MASSEADELRGQLYATHDLLTAAREEITRLERQLEYEALIDNQRFWREVEDAARNA